jgi:fumarate reductase subunit C
VAHGTSTRPKARTKEYVRPIPATWWLSKRSYLLFMIRELSSGFLAAYAVFLLVLLRQSGAGAGEFQAFFHQLRSPVSMVLHAVALCFALYNTITTFNLAPRVLSVRRGEDTLPDGLISGVHYVAFAVATVVLVLIALNL